MDAAAAAPAARVLWRPLREWGADDLGPASVAISASALMVASTVPGGKTRAVVGAMLASFFTLFFGVWLSTVGRGRRGIGLVNLCVSFVALAVAVFEGGNFDPDLLLKIYGALTD